MTMIPAIDAQGVVMHTDNGETWRRVARADAGGLRRVAGNAWPLLQGTAAATAAWVIARRLGDHPDPFFAPIVKGAQSRTWPVSCQFAPIAAR